jgi:hypothetical protein
MAMMTLILADSGFGKTYSLRNVNPENAILARCIRKALPFKNNGGWKLHGKRLPDNSIQRGTSLIFATAVTCLTLFKTWQTADVGCSSSTIFRRSCSTKT